MRLLRIVVPGETPASAGLELARTIIRRAERRAVSLGMAGLLPGEHLVPYLNRLADLVWVLARAAEQAGLTSFLSRAGTAAVAVCAKIELEIAQLDGADAAAFLADLDLFAMISEPAGCPNASLEALDQAIQIHGGNGMALEYGLADLWFIARLHKTAPVSREMILNFVSQHSLGLPKSY